MGKIKERKNPGYCELQYFLLDAAWGDHRRHIPYENCRRWDLIVVALESLDSISGRGNCICHVRKSLQNTVFYRIFPLFLQLTLHSFRMRIKMSKVSLEEFECSLEEMNRNTASWKEGWWFAGEQFFPLKISFQKTSNLSTATKDVPCLKTLSSLMCVREFVEF